MTKDTTKLLKELTQEEWVAPKSETKSLSLELLSDQIKELQDQLRALEMDFYNRTANYNQTFTDLQSQINELCMRGFQDEGEE